MKPTPPKPNVPRKKVKAVRQEMPIGLTAIMPPGMVTRPFFILPADAESYDAMVQVMAKAHYDSLCCPGAYQNINDYCVKHQQDAVMAALAAIGITRAPGRAGSGRGGNKK